MPILSAALQRGPAAEHDAGGGRGVRRALRAGVAGLVLLAVAEATLRVIGHDDLWWNLATGRWIVEHLRVPTVDVFSHTFAGAPWINPEWGSHLLFYLVYRLGEGWIVVLRGALIAAVLGVAVALTLRRSRSWLLSLAVAALGGWVCLPFLDARPQLLTFLFALLLLLVLDLVRRDGRDRLLWSLPALHLVWAQVHGGYVLGLLILVGNVGVESLKRLSGLPSEPLEWRRIGRLAAATAGSAAAVAVNPWGLEAFTHPLAMSRLVGDSVYLTVAEWRPPELAHLPAEFNPGQFWLFLALTVVAVLPIALVAWRSFDFNDVGLAVALAVLFALPHRRFIPLFVLLTLPLLGHALAFWAGRWSGGAAGAGLLRSPHRGLRRTAAAAALLCWLLLAAVAPPRLLRARAVYAADSLFRVNVHASFYPEGAVDFVRRVPVPGLMFNLYNWGGYLEHALPEHPTFIDGRAQMAFPDEFYLEYLEIHRGGPRWRELLDRYGVGWALLHSGRNGALLERISADPAWRWIFAEGESALVVRVGPKSQELLERFRSGRLPVPPSARSFFLRGLDAEHEGKLEHAAAAFGRAAALDPADDEARGRWISALAAAGRREEAEVAAVEAARDLPESAAVRLAAARVAARAGRGEEAFLTFAAVLERWPERLEAVDGLWSLDPARALALCDAALETAPVRPWARLARGRAAELGGDLRRAHELYVAEGRDAFERGDADRMARSRQALEDLLARRPGGAPSGEPQQPLGSGSQEEGGQPAGGEEEPEG